MSKKNRRRKNSSQEAYNETLNRVNEQKKPIAIVNPIEKEEATNKIFNISETPTSENTKTNKKIITNPVDAWGKPR